MNGLAGNGVLGTFFIFGLLGELFGAKAFVNFKLAAG
jgi:hypothetical protein